MRHFYLMMSLRINFIISTSLSMHNEKEVRIEEVVYSGQKSRSHGGRANCN